MSKQREREREREREKKKKKQKTKNLKKSEKHDEKGIIEQTKDESMQTKIVLKILG